MIAALVDTDDEWIRSRTGIAERRVVGPDETTASMCLEAGRRALRVAGLEARDLDLVICATTTPDHLLPATACLVQREIGAVRAGAFDLNAACSGFLSALTVGAQFVQCGTCERVLVVGGETLTRFTDWHDRNTCILFGDGAAAVVLEASFQDCGVLSSVMGSRGDVERMLTIEAGGSCRPASAQTVAEGAHLIRMRGNEVFRHAVRAMHDASCRALQKAGLSIADVRKVIPHQANQRIITATQEALHIASDKVFVNIERLGNTGAASVGIALADFLSTEAVEPGDNLLLVSFGGGLTWASVVLRWADVPAARRERVRTSEGHPGDPVPTVSCPA
jgi:3-oxoacyl-[acyl-carrier-protein] synthase-3